MFKFSNHHVRESAKIYGEALIDACRQAKVIEPKQALLDTDAFPRLLKIPNVEYAIGWLHGCAESHGVLVEVLWFALLAELGGESMTAARERFVATATRKKARTS
jgi:hypothetical protein